MGPLSGVRIMDLSRLLPGPLATQLLVDLGAQVTKIENSEVGGDPLRHYPPFAKDGQSAMYHALNRGKRSVSFPFRDPQAHLKLRQLIESADVLVESFRPGTLEKMLKINDISELLEANPKLVVARISGFGAKCPDPGHDLNFVAAAGVLGMMHKPDTLPVQFADIVGGSWPTALQIVSALYQRDHNSSNPGQQSHTNSRLIDIKMAVGAHAGLVLPIARRSVSDDPIGGGIDFLCGRGALYGVFETKCGGSISIGALEAHFWTNLCKATGVNENYTMEDAFFNPKAKQDIKNAMLQKSAEEWEVELLRSNVPAHRVVAPEDSVKHLEELTGDPMMIDVEIVNKQKSDEGGEKITQLSLPRMPLSIGTPASTPAPRLGVDNNFMLKKEDKKK